MIELQSEIHLQAVAQGWWNSGAKASFRNVIGNGAMKSMLETRNKLPMSQNYRRQEKFNRVQLRLKENDFVEKAPTKVKSISRNLTVLYAKQMALETPNKVFISRFKTKASCKSPKKHLDPYPIYRHLWLTFTAISTFAAMSNILLLIYFSSQFLLSPFW